MEAQSWKWEDSFKDSIFKQATYHTPPEVMTKPLLAKKCGCCGPISGLDQIATTYELWKRAQYRKKLLKYKLEFKKLRLRGTTKMLMFKRSLVASNMRRCRVKLRKAPLTLSVQCPVDCGLFNLNMDYKADSVGCRASTFPELCEFAKYHGIPKAQDYDSFQDSRKDCNVVTAPKLRIEGMKRIKSRVPKFINMHPIVATMNLTKDFSRIRGRRKREIYNEPMRVPRCDDEQNLHSVLVFGHGRRFGEDYALVKHNAGVNWGVGGMGLVSMRSLSHFAFAHGPFRWVTGHPPEGSYVPPGMDAMK